jgi:hypothetical protein
VKEATCKAHPYDNGTVEWFLRMIEYSKWFAQKLRSEAGGQ